MGVVTYSSGWADLFDLTRTNTATTVAGSVHADEGVAQSTRVAIGVGHCIVGVEGIGSRVGVAEAGMRVVGDAVEH